MTGPPPAGGRQVMNGAPQWPTQAPVISGAPGGSKLGSRKPCSPRLRGTSQRGEVVLAIILERGVGSAGFWYLFSGWEFIPTSATRMDWMSWRWLRSLKFEVPPTLADCRCRRRDGAGVVSGERPPPALRPLVMAEPSSSSAEWLPFRRVVLELEAADVLGHRGAETGCWRCRRR